MTMVRFIGVFLSILTVFVGGNAFGIFPDASTLPIIDETLVNGVFMFRTIAVNFPPFSVALTAFIYLMTFKMFLKLIMMLPIVNGVLYKTK